MTNHFQTLDSLIAKLKVLEKTQATTVAIQCVLDAGVILNSTQEETHKSVFPTVAPLTKENVVEFLDTLVQDFKTFRQDLREEAEELFKKYFYADAMIIMQVNIILIKAQAFIAAYTREIKDQFSAMNEYEALLKDAKNVVIIVNEEIKGKQLEGTLKSLWKEIWEKQVYLHNEHQKLVSEYMKADNIHYESLHCEDCIKKFDIKDTIFYTVGFKATDKLPVDISEEAFIVQI